MTTFWVELFRRCIFLDKVVLSMKILHHGLRAIHSDSQLFGNGVQIKCIPNLIDL